MPAWSASIRRSARRQPDLGAAAGRRVLADDGAARHGPASWPAACLVFIPAVGEFVIPDLLGGADTLMIGRTLWVEFFNNRDWPLASAVAVVLLMLLVAPIVLFQRHQDQAAGDAVKRGLTPVTVLALLLGFGFLYLPIAVLVLYSPSMPAVW